MEHQVIFIVGYSYAYCIDGISLGYARFQPNVLIANVTFVVHDDHIGLEPDEVFILKMRNLTSQLERIDPTYMTITVLDDESILK